MMRKRLPAICSTFLLTVALCGISFSEDGYVEDWSEFENYPVPEWFLDAKIGMYAHWGPYSVPTFMTEWYPHWMYRSEKDHPRGLMEYHSEVYGDIRNFGYKEFIPQFTADHFDPEEWALLFKETGARFAGITAEHHDGFSMWDSDVSRWNSVDMGPKRDVVGELFAAYRAQGLKTVATLHTPRNLHGYFTRVEGLDTADEEYHDLYGQYTDMDLAHNLWLEEVKELMDKYQPDQVYYDGELDKIPELVRMEMMAHYYNRAKEWNKEVMLAYKGTDLPEGTAVIDVEKGKLDRLQERGWQTDDCLNTHSWDYMGGNFFKPRPEIIHDLIDIVSKNGVMMLNVGPKADGTIDSKTRKYLRMLGAWLKVNGEAIYDTRPWKTHGEGLALYDSGRGFGDDAQEAAEFTNQDFRFTQKDGALFVLCFGWPEDEFTLQSMKVTPGQDAQVTLLGHPDAVSHIVSDDGYLTILTPELQPNERPCGYAYAFKLENFNPEPSIFISKDVIQLRAAQAERHSKQFRVNTVYHREVLNNWGKPSDRVSWTLNVPQAGEYAVRAEVNGVLGEANLLLEVDNQKRAFTAQPATDWYCSRLTDIESIHFDQPGEYEVTLKCADPKQWKSAHVWKIELAPK